MAGNAVVDSACPHWRAVVLACKISCSRSLTAGEPSVESTMKLEEELLMSL